MRSRKSIFTAFIAATIMMSSASCVGQTNKNLVIVDNGIRDVTIVAAPDANIAAKRLEYLMAQDAGAAPASDDRKICHGEIVLCTAASLSNVKKHLPVDIANVELKPEGFLLVSDAGDPWRIIIVGADTAGLRYGVGEFWNYHVMIASKTATVNFPFRIIDAPAFSKRILWNWNFMTNWDEDLFRIHQTLSVDPGGKLQPYLEQPDGYERHFRSVVDYASDHKLNGLIIYGFLNDRHGGVDSGKRLSKYAKDNAVRILPGIGTVIYGGFYHDGANQYNLPYWMSKHPEVRLMVGKDGNSLAGVPCPSDPNLRAFLVEGSKWFFETFKDIGGVNIEHGDFFECQCEFCKAQRAKPENDTNFLWDMTNTHLPVITTGHAINPDLWYTFSPYWGYNKSLMTNPPKFLKQYPDYGIVQWTYSGMMMDPNNWPSDLKPPAGTRHSIGLLHQGSYWQMPSRWWASPGDSYGLIADLIRRTCRRAAEDNSEGLEIVGQIGNASPQNELNYLAFEAFTWNPRLTMTEWMETRLPAIYGSAELAKKFYALVDDNSVNAAELITAIAEAKQISKQLADPRQSKRWENLARELTRRHALVEKGQTKPFGPGPLEGVQDVTIQF